MDCGMEAEAEAEAWQLLRRGAGFSDPDRRGRRSRRARPRPSFSSLVRSAALRKSVDFSRRRRRRRAASSPSDEPRARATATVSASVRPSFCPRHLPLTSHRTTAVFSLFFLPSFLLSFSFRLLLLLLLLLPLASFLPAVLHYILPSSPGSLPNERTNMSEQPSAFALQLWN